MRWEKSHLIFISKNPLLQFITKFIKQKIFHHAKTH